mmetsp:Transcript_15486/g.39888  ORF Transcript_15486/g.39888 Transcript_15486/m.39888 type:complete len:92 (-) Transcript_15486:170-445(-)
MLVTTGVARAEHSEFKPQARAAAPQLFKTHAWLSPDVALPKMDGSMQGGGGAVVVVVTVETLTKPTNGVGTCFTSKMLSTGETSRARKPPP